MIKSNINCILKIKLLNMDYFLYGYFNLEKSFDNLNLKFISICYSIGKVISLLFYVFCYIFVQMSDFKIDESDDYK